MSDDGKGKKSFVERSGKKNFVEALSKSQGNLVYLVHGKEDGREAWYYLLVDKLKLPLFKAKINGGNANLNDFGKLLYSGWGENPPDDIVEKVKEEYGS